MGVMGGDVMCPVCGDGEQVVMVEDGVWMCVGCACEFNEDGVARGGYPILPEFRTQSFDELIGELYQRWIWRGFA